MTDDVLRLVPPAMARVLRRHRAALAAGGSDLVPGFGDVPGSGGALGAAEASGYTAVLPDSDLAMTVSGTIDSLRHRSPVRSLVPQFAIILNGAFGRNDPYAVSPLTRTGRKSTCSSVRFAATRPGYERFTEQVFRKAPLVFYGWDAWPAPPARAAGAMELPRPATGLVLERAGAMRKRSAENAEDLCRAFFPNGPSSDAVSSQSFDDHSIPFAVAALSRSHAVSDAANLLMAVWTGSGGNIEGTPYLKEKVTPAGAEDGVH